jgi:hypothetical protein
VTVGWQPSYTFRDGNYKNIIVHCSYQAVITLCFGIILEVVDARLIGFLFKFIRSPFIRRQVGTIGKNSNDAVFTKANAAHRMKGSNMKHIPFIAVALIMLVSCNQEDSEILQPAAPQEQVTEYFPLTVGNYWVYSIYEADTSLAFVASTMRDSIVVLRDSIHLGSAYKVVQSSLWGITLYKDSAGFIITGSGDKLFTLNTSIKSLVNRDIPGTVEPFHEISTMKKNDSVIVVPSGVYAAKWVLGTVTTNAEVPSWQKSRNFYYAFAKNVGLVYQRHCWLGSPGYLEWRLIRYHVK